VMQRFKSTEHVQSFLSIFGPIGNPFRSPPPPPLSQPISPNTS
jgi:hypothetical protein